jgi:hypothetical protein
MKNIIILLFGLCSITLFSQSVVSNATPAGAISNTSATVNCDAYASTGVNNRYVVLMGTSPSSLVPRDSVIRTGAGFATAINISFLLTGLPASTTQYYEFQVKNNSTGALIMQTTTNRYFTTTTNPVSATLTMNTSPQPFIGGGRLIINTNNAGQSGTLVAYANESGYSGSGWQFTSTSKSLNGSFVTTTDTLTFTGMGNNPVSGEIRFIPSSGGTISPLTFGFTPTTAVRPTVYSSPTVNYRYDTMQIVTQTNQSAGGNDSVKIDGFDSTNTLIFTRKMRVNDQLITGVFVNYFNGISYPVGKLFTIRQTVWNTTGRDSVTTTQYRMLIAPTVTQAITNSSIKAKSAWFDVKLTNNDYFCLTRHTFRYRKNGVTDWEYGDTMNYSANNSVRRISLNNLDFSSNYEFILTTINCSGVTYDYSYPFSTIAPLPAPTISPLLANGGCGSSTLNPFSIIPQKKDTALVEIGIIIPPRTVAEIIDWYYIDGSYNDNGYTVSLPANTDITWVVFVTSKDGAENQRSTSARSNMLDLPTPNRSKGSVTDSNAYINVFGGGGCGDTIYYGIKVTKKGSSKIVYELKDKLPVVGNNYELKNILIPNLEPGTTYIIETGSSNEKGKNWVACPTDLEIITDFKITSTIIQGANSDLWLTQESLVYDMTGRLVGQGILHLVKDLPKNQTLNCVILNKDGQVIAHQKKIQKE